jgi:carboxylate-amine ligase
MPRTVGVEEELLLVDPDTRLVSSRAAEVLRGFHEAVPEPTTAADELDHELFRHQLETRTDPATDLADIATQLVAGRRRAGEAARAADLVLVASGVVPLSDAEPRLTQDDRYEAMLGTFGEVARTGGTCGMHVHVAVDCDEEGVAVIDAITPWLPVVLAISANSPFYLGHETGYASWRAQVWSRWPSAGPNEPFGSAAAYHDVSRRMIELGAARDPGMLYFDARLSVEHPTVEVRVCDVCTDVEDPTLVAALVRGLVTAAADGDLPTPLRRVEELRAAQWRASRYGLGDRLVHPVERTLRPAREVLRALVDAVLPGLEDAGDVERVESGVERVLGGGGAARQRAAYERTGEVEGVVDDLVERTRLSWES